MFRLSPLSEFCNIISHTPTVKKFIEIMRNKGYINISIFYHITLHAFNFYRKDTYFPTVETDYYY